jgi:uncharacterized glyoxalase superfamily protein PhnB
MVEFGDGVIGIGTQGADGAVSPKNAGIASRYISASVDDVDGHDQRALAAGPRITCEPRNQARSVRASEALDVGGQRWRFAQPAR